MKCSASYPHFKRSLSTDIHRGAHARACSSQDWDNINVDWFSNRQEENIPLPEYKLSFVWTERNIAVAVDQVYSRGQVRAEPAACTPTCTMPQASQRETCCSQASIWNMSLASQRGPCRWPARLTANEASCGKGRPFSSTERK